MIITLRKIDFRDDISRREYSRLLSKYINENQCFPDQFIERIYKDEQNVTRVEILRNARLVSAQENMLLSPFEFKIENFEIDVPFRDPDFEDVEITNWKSYTIVVSFKDSGKRYATIKMHKHLHSTMGPNSMITTLIDNYKKNSSVFNKIVRFFSERKDDEVLHIINYRVTKVKCTN